MNGRIKSLEPVIKTRKDIKNIEHNKDYVTELEIPFTKSKNNKENLNVPTNINFEIEIVIKSTYEQIRGNERQMLGYIGIINEATTCYINSMIQSLFILGQFKKLLFSIPVTNENNDNIILSLQRLFYDLMTNEQPVSINNLLNSFGWGKAEASVQHDVQEFNLHIFDIMQKQLKGTHSEDIYCSLFEGTIVNYIKCINVDYSSQKEEKFIDLSLTVKVNSVLSFIRALKISITALIYIPQKSY